MPRTHGGSGLTALAQGIDTIRSVAGDTSGGDYLTDEAKAYQDVVMYYPDSPHFLDAENFLRQNNYPIPSPSGS